MVAAATLTEVEFQLMSQGEKWLPLLWALPLLPGWALGLHNFTTGGDVGVLIMTIALTLMWLSAVAVMVFSRPEPDTNRKGARAAVIFGHRFSGTRQAPRNGFSLLAYSLLAGFTAGTVIAFVNAAGNGAWLTAWSMAMAMVELVAILSMTGYLRERDFEETLV
ncbi:hypothetical protein [Kocuria rosea]|uniref:hypothetical protein n=1 Tax=Kocuria rosea TaxID=1275 RepID=UPI00232D72D7|nr:hypothetical protein [Kocuria rosea]